MIDTITERLKQKGLKGSFLEEMIDHFASDYEAQLHHTEKPQQALQIILSKIDQQDLKPLQRKIFLIHHRKKLIFMTILFALLSIAFFTTPQYQTATRSITPIAVTESDSLILGKLVEGEIHITANFGRHWHPIKKERRMHKGLDIRGNVGDNIFAPLSGIVEEVGEDEKRGKYIEINHADGFTTRYYHLSHIAVKANQSVERGSIIGKIGNTGMSTGPHLHFEILKNEMSLDPENYLRA